LKKLPSQFINLLKNRKEKAEWNEKDKNPLFGRLLSFFSSLKVFAGEKYDAMPEMQIR